jgi:hypothetical protein
MATKYFINGGVDTYWATSTNWSPAGVPTSADDVIFDANSPNCYAGSGSVCRSMNMSLYPSGRVFTIGSIMYVGDSIGGDCDFSGAFTFATSGQLILVATCSVVNITAGTTLLPFFYLGDPVNAGQAGPIWNINSNLTCIFQYWNCKYK